MDQHENVVPIRQPDESAGKSAGGGIDRSVEARWTPKLARPYCAVSSYFLKNYHRLRPHPDAKGLNSTEAMLVIQLVDHKWDARAPYPTVGTLATRMGISRRAVRQALKNLEDQGYLRRQLSTVGGPSRYHLEGLFTALERLYDADLATDGEVD